MTIVGRHQTFHSSYKDPFKFFKYLIYRRGEWLQLHIVDNRHRGMKYCCNITDPPHPQCHHMFL